MMCIDLWNNRIRIKILAFLWILLFKDNIFPAIGLLLRSVSSLLFKFDGNKNSRLMSGEAACPDQVDHSHPAWYHYCVGSNLTD